LANKAVDISKKRVFVIGSVGPYATYLANGSEYNGFYMNEEKFNKEVCFYSKLLRFYNRVNKNKCNVFIDNKFTKISF
jgi:S-methylmethionine-dependent homocysteine/selenocysteine methylase